MLTLPLFLNLTGRDVLLVGGGPVATAKLRQLLAAGAHVRVVAPEVADEIRSAAARRSWRLERRPFAPADLDDVWLVVAAATPEVNRAGRRGRRGAAHLRQRRRRSGQRDARSSSGVVRRDGVTLAISTSGDAPALTALLREALDALLPRDLAAWMWQARAARVAWRRDGVPMDGAQAAAAAGAERAVSTEQTPQDERSDRVSTSSLAHRRDLRGVGCDRACRG